MAATPQPTSDDWRKAQAISQKAADSDVLKVLRDALKDLNEDLADINKDRRIGEAVRREQLQVVRRSLLERQAEVMRATGKIVESRRLEAAARAVKLSGVIDSVIFEAAGLDPSYHKELQSSILKGMENTLDRAIARLNGSSVPLSRRVYKIDEWLSGRVDRMVNAALAQGLTAREFAAKARDWISPNTPGGVRYASMRLARTEINNAFHAMAVQGASEKPWVEAMNWKLSSSHPKPDECDKYAADSPYEPRNVPRKPHPHCFCYVTPEVEDRDKFLDNLISGKYDSYMRSKGVTPSGQFKPATREPRPKPSPVSELPKTTDRPTPTAKDPLNRVQGEAREQVQKVLDDHRRAVPKAMQRFSGIRLMDKDEAREFSRRHGKDALGGYTVETREIAMHPQTLSAGYKRQFEKERGSGFITPCGRDHDHVGSFVAHEMGHHVDTVMRMADPSKVRAVWKQVGEALGLKPPMITMQRDLDKWVEKNRDVIAKKISKYGATDSAELLAEAWAEYITNPNARPASRAIGKAMEELAK